MDVANYNEFVADLELRLQTIQTEYIAQQNRNAQLIGPLLAITMLVKSDLLPFARDRYKSVIDSPDWKIAEDYLLSFKDEVEYMLAGPMAFQQHKAG